LSNNRSRYDISRIVTCQQCRTISTAGTLAIAGISSNNKVPRKVLMPETPGTPETLATTMADGNVNSSMNSSNSRECRHSRTPGISTAVRNQ
jgi:hypothetical protein